MPRPKQPAISADLLDCLLAGTDAATAQEINYLPPPGLSQ